MAKKNIIEVYNWLSEAFVHQTEETTEQNIKDESFDFFKMLAEDEKMFFKLLINFAEKLDEFTTYYNYNETTHQGEIEWYLAMIPKGFDEFLNDEDLICDSEDETFLINAPFGKELCAPHLLAIRNDELYVYFVQQGSDDINVRKLFSKLTFEQRLKIVLCLENSLWNTKQSHLWYFCSQK